MVLTAEAKTHDFYSALCSCRLSRKNGSAVFKKKEIVDEY